ncbi:MAG: hypothetical protein ABSF41_12710 [Pseudolabrys sp.]
MPQAAKCIAAALILGFAAAAQAQTVAPAGEPAPRAEAGTTAQSKCISEDDNYVRLGKGVGFRIELTNRCEQRITCKVFVYITSAKGPAQGRGTIVLAPKSTGSYTMRAKMNGGSSQSTRECRVS